MESIPKFLASVITIIIGVLLCVSMVISAVVVNSARVYHASVIDNIEASDFYDAAVAKCTENAKASGYRLYIDKDDDATGPRSFCKVTLEYDLSAPIFGKVHTGTLVGYALSGAHMDVIVPGVEPGLYKSDSDYNEVVTTWSELEKTGVVSIVDGVVKTSSSAADVLVGDLILPRDGSVKEISDSAFAQCVNITGVKFPDSLAIVGANAFDNCTSLKKIEFGKGLTTIKESAFASCSNIANVNYIGNIDGWCDISFANSQANPLYSAGTGADLYFNGQMVESVVIPAEVISIANKFIGCTSIKSVLIPDGSYLSQIPDNAFFNCTNLLSVSIGSGVRYIGDASFSKCTNLRSIMIPASIENISSIAFSECNSLQNIFVSEGNAYYRDNNGRSLIDNSTGNVIAGVATE